MLKSQIHRYLLVSKQRLNLRSSPCQIPPRRYVELSAKQRSPYPESTPSQLLRFALTGTTKRPQYNVFDPSLDLHLSEAFNNKLPSPFWVSLQRTPEAPASMPSRLDTRQIKSLPDFQIFIENNVTNKKGCRRLQSQHCVPLFRALERCQRHDQFAEILSAINGIVTRIERIDGQCSQRLYVLGMYYAALAFSAPALQRYLQGYLAVSSQRLGPNESRLLVHALLDALKYLDFCDGAHDIGAITSLVAGEDTTKQIRLHDILYWAGPDPLDIWSGSYFTLLVKLGNKQLQEALWAHLIQGLSPKSHENQFRAAYTCVEALIDVGATQRAVAYLRQISERANCTLPYISKAKSLCDSLSADELQPSLVGEKEHTEILNQRLADMEDQLGIRWQSDMLLHSSASNPLMAASEQPLLTIDGDSTGYDSVERLLAQIQNLGCSKSNADLGQIAESLHEHDGSLIYISVISDVDIDLEYAWCPQVSPVEFPESLSPAGTDFSRPWTPSTLGLLRVSVDSNGQSSAEKRSLHLMQLGTLVARPKAYQEQGSPDATNWEQTGHIFAWDRFHGRFVAVFVGQTHGAADHCIEPGQSKLRHGLSSIIAVNSLIGLDSHWSSDRVTAIGSGATTYHLHVDKSPDLLS
ncbi:uncharacterized protein BO97DRAFT_406561 [Aspergillus homomorphus CBS 101889]|uniref:Uncharacterized protein n=1 Tax=Aspergillus homomorphus (strain CBS 101889) TaxID=1450537 RepID=A0A395HUJ9_ASPHC|nr:hypothetical protein BO97DRAFT_406561 [Aspergillus homomorphus CBS 101889]RAL11065.1 hypothetical protein BO97DRAFT_406561 [Aspergillus homomorphus CBS 101889]